jgi:hypothetical protein
MRSLTISLCAFLAVHVGQIFGLSTLGNSLFDLSGVFFWGIVLYIKGLSASNHPLVESISLVMSFLTKQFSLLMNYIQMPEPDYAKRSFFSQMIF